MIHKQETYNYFNLLYLMKHWIIFCFLLFFVAKPVVFTIALITESKFEYNEKLVNESIEEKKENISDDERINRSIVYKTGTFSNQALSYYYNCNLFLSFKPKIHLRPPIL